MFPTIGCSNNLAVTYLPITERPSGRPRERRSFRMAMLVSVATSGGASTSTSRFEPLVSSPASPASRASSSRSASCLLRIILLVPRSTAPTTSGCDQSSLTNLLASASIGAVKYGCDSACLAVILLLGSRVMSRQSKSAESGPMASSGKTSRSDRGVQCGYESPLQPSLPSMSSQLVRLGVPNSLKMDKSWSNVLAPCAYENLLKSEWPRWSSAKMQPALHTSTSGPYISPSSSPSLSGGGSLSGPPAK
mmetsp:Transcript_1744/g.7789  ORF Transcript_1744/g.7789 Transcript_1744/m.7789 type:complete len:249 (-) Transcript_1744:1323-2069(-)